MSPFFQDPALYRSVLENLPIGIYVLDREQRVRFWNRGAEQITGYLAQEVLGHTCRDPLPHCDLHGQVLAGDHCPVTTTFRDGRAVRNHVFTLHKQGHRLGVKVHTLPLFDDKDAIVGVAVTFEEALENSAEQSSGRMFGCLDPQTGVPSQRLAKAVVTESLAGLNETHGGLGLMRVRVLGLKEFAAKYGANSIAAFLHATAQTLLHNLDAESFLGRWGENEFIVMLQSASPIKVAATAESIGGLLNRSEIAWWGDRFCIQAEVESTVARSGDKLELLLSRMRPAHAGGAARAAGAGGAANSADHRG